MRDAKRAEVWLTDLGPVAKVRPCLILSVPADGPNDRVLVACVSHTTSTRGTRFEVSIPVRFLQAGAFDAQSIVTVPHAKLIRRLGVLSATQMTQVESVVRLWLGLI